MKGLLVATNSLVGQACPFTVNPFRMNPQDCLTKKIVNHPSGWLTYKLRCSRSRCCGAAELDR